MASGRSVLECAVQFGDLTTVEAARARDEGAVLLLPVGSIEPHGPHLPLSTDILIAEETARRTARRLADAGVRALVLPAFAFSTVQFSAGFAGAIGVTGDSSEEALADLLVPALEQGYRAVALVNAHLEPAAIDSLRAQGIDEVSLNFAAFARFIHSPRGPAQRLFRRGLGWADAVFQIERLYRFSAKFFPRWEPRYLMYEGALGLARVALAAMWIEGQLPKPRLLPSTRQRKLDTGAVAAKK